MEAKWKRAHEQARAGEELDDKQIASKYALEVHLLRYEVLSTRKLPDTEEQMLWYWGKVGTGKSRRARAEHPGAYVMPCTKWWDGYNDQEVVIIEGVDASHRKFAHRLKLWGDRYSCRVDVKDGSIVVRPKLLIVTSNLHPKEIWDGVELEGILSRFKCEEFK